jgi:hypothetical protein
MNICRRRLLGTVAVGMTALGLPRSLTSERAAAQPLDLAGSTAGAARFQSFLLPQVRAALDRHSGHIAHRDVVGLVDFSAPSRAVRFYLLDIGDSQIISTHLVAHGRGSDPANSGWVEHLSNAPGSNASCDGAFVTGQTYFGEHGRSRRLIGLEPQNDMAEARAIVIHAASYVSPDLAIRQGRVGRSQGCFAVARSEIDDVLELLGEGRLLFAAR